MATQIDTAQREVVLIEEAHTFDPAERNQGARRPR
jgi:hypothetical protein